MTSTGRRLFNFTMLGFFLATLSLLYAVDQSTGIIGFENLKNPREATVVFYNVENLFDTINDPEKKDDDFTPSGKYAWNSERYYHKCDQLAAVIAATAGDDLPVIVGLAEVENEAVLKDLVARDALAKGNYEVIHFTSLDERGIDVAMLYRKKIFKPEHIETLFVNLGTGERPTRDILYVNGKLNNGPSLHIFINHWPSRYGGQEASEPKRMAAAAVLRRAVDNLIANDPNASILIMGDFNDYPDNESVRTALSAKGTDDSGLLVNLMQGKENDLRGTYNYRGEWGFLDQIIVSRSMYEGGLIMVKPGSAAPYSSPDILFTDPKYGDEKPNRSYGGTEYYGGFSDHLPVKAILLY